MQPETVPDGKGHSPRTSLRILAHRSSTAASAPRVTCRHGSRRSASCARASPP